jgi:hypothetical protein
MTWLRFARGAPGSGVNMPILCLGLMVPANACTRSLWEWERTWGLSSVRLLPCSLAVSLLGTMKPSYKPLQ